MKIKKHFRTATSTIDYVIADLNMTRIGDKPLFFRYCVDKRLQLLSTKYDERLDKILSYLILNCSYDTMPLDSLSRIIMSLSKVTNALSKGFMSLLDKELIK